MTKLKVLIANPELPDFLDDILIKKGYNVVRCTVKPGPHPDDLKEKLPGCHAIIWWPNAANPYRNLTKELLTIAGPNLRAICTISAGIDSLDIDEIKRRDIKLSNMAKVQDAAVADMALLLALATSRRMGEFCRQKYTDWSTRGSDWLMGVDLQDSVVGIVGLGNIGKAIMERLRGFQVRKFLYTGGREKSLAESNGAIYCQNFGNFLRESDFVFVSCPLVEQTRHMFNLEAFKKMKKTSILINIARGAIIHTDSLVQALEDQLIWAAGLDVTDPEPLPDNHKLLSLPNCIIMPHKGSQTCKTRKAMFKLAAENIILALEGQPMRTPVNL